MPAVHEIFLADSAKVTVVFVHGSRGHYVTNWGSSSAEKNWIYWIGPDLGQADVLSVQHEANFWSVSDEGTIADYAETVGHAIAQMVRTKRIVFVGYSLGGHYR